MADAPKPIPDGAQEKAQEVLARTDANGERRFSQVRVNPVTGTIEARDVKDHTVWTTQG